ncbi:MAG: hypothetical protein QOF01_5216, partial [Thermomicrobiales bacterium]|nr:hypothetical protein [Thermomicrobiales bacterium]
GDYRRILWEHGSQWLYGGADGDGRIVALSITPSYVYALGDATDLYNSTYETSTDILHASRSIVWLAPDVIVVYDRATSKTDGRFKRFWLQLPAVPEVDGNRAVVTTATGQQLVVTTLLPANAAITPGPLDPDEPPDEPANGEPMVSWLRVEAPGGPADVRFLHVLQGVDAGAAADAAVLFESDDGAFAGAVVGTTAVLFPVEVGADVGELTYEVPADTTAHLITGLAPGGRYDATIESDGGVVRVSVAPGTSVLADDGGVLAVGLPTVSGDVPSPTATGEGPEATTAPSPSATVPAAEPTAAPTEPLVATATGAAPADATATATPATAGGESLGVELGERDGSGVNGLALLAPEGDRTAVTLLVQGATAEQVVLVHRGTCAALDPNPAFLLARPDATGHSQSALGVALAALRAEPHAIAIHASAGELGTVVACGDIPAG